MCNPKYEDDLQKIFLVIVYIHGVLNVLIRGTELMLSMISTCFMLIPFFSGNYAAFHAFLNDEATGVLWKGPYPEIFANELETSRNLSIIENSARFHMNLQIWSKHFLWKAIIFIYAIILVLATRKQSYSLNLVWLSFAVTLLLKSFLEFCIDLIISDFFQRPTQIQVLQGLDLCFQILIVVIISLHTRSLYFKEETIRIIDRYNDYKRSEEIFPEITDGITISRLTNENSNNNNTTDNERY